jgi:hypothetical protein
MRFIPTLILLLLAMSPATGASPQAQLAGDVDADVAARVSFLTAQLRAHTDYREDTQTNDAKTRLRTEVDGFVHRSIRPGEGSSSIEARLRALRR